MSSDIHLGDDVYFEFEITANPTTYNVTWQHNVRILQISYLLKLFFASGQTGRRKCVKWGSYWQSNFSFAKDKAF